MGNNLIERCVRQDIRETVAYKVVDANGLIKLDAMESPYAWPDSLLDEWLAELKSVPVNRYPDPNAEILKNALLQWVGMEYPMDIMLGNGSDELIQIVTTAVAKPDCVVLAPEPTFVMYSVIAKITGVKFIGVPLRENFALDPDAILSAIKKYSPTLVFLAYPNNPTGNLFSREIIIEIVEACAGIVVLDEAYYTFAQQTFLSELKNYENLLVFRTFSKMGFAGLRLGFLVGSQNWLNEFNKVRMPYNINSLTLATMHFALKHLSVFETQAKLITDERQWLWERMQKIDEIQVYASDANFLLFRCKVGQGSNIYDAIKKKGVLIKNLHSQGTVLADCLRVTIGTPEENRAFLHALENVL